MMRIGQTIELPAESYARYKALHEAIWPGVAETIRACRIQNYSIYHRDGVLFSYFEYVGDDFEADMAKMAADPVTQQWWDVVKPIMKPFANRKPDEFWSDMEEVFHQD